MFEFHAASDGWLQVQADPAGQDGAAIRFLAADRRETLVQVTLWPAEGRAVLRLPPGSDLVAPLGGGPGLIRIAFAPGGLQVLADGAVLFDLRGAAPEGLDAIAWVALENGFQPASLALGGAANAARTAAGGLVLAAPFGVEGWAMDRALPRQDLHLDFGAMAEPPQVFQTARPDLAEPGVSAVPQAVHAQLPGRIWTTAGSDTGLWLRLTANGQPCAAPLWVGRAEVLAAIEGLLAQPGVEGQSETALLALEHVQHGGFWPHLSEPARRGLVQVARAYRLEALLPDAAAPEREPDAAPGLSDAALAQRALAEFGARLRADPAADLGRHLAALPPLTQGVLTHLFTVLTEAFCAGDRFQALAARAHALGVDLPMPGDHPWQISIALPHHFLAGRLLRLREDLRRLVTAEPDGEISTVAVGWVVERVASAGDPVLSADQREAVAAIYLDLLQRRAESYWGRTACVHLIGASLALLQAAPRLRADLAARVRQVVLQVHGLSPRFWQMAAEARAAGRLPALPDLVAGEAAFAAVARVAEGGTTDTAALDAALDGLERSGRIDAPRLRRELLGPLGVAGAPAGFLGHLMAQGEAAGAEALRALAFPGAAKALAPETIEVLTPLVRDAVLQAHDRIEHAPRLGLQAEASERIAAILAAGGAGAGELDRLFVDLSALARDQGLGLALAIALADGLLRQNCGAVAEAVLARTARLIAALPEAVRAEVTVRNAGAALLAHLPEGSTAGDLVRALPGVVETLQRLPAAPDPGLQTGPLHDIAVVVISCSAYLDNRIPALRQAWLDGLQALGIPWLVAVGGAEGPARREGQVLHLPVADDYEGLPAKVLAAFDWMRQNSRAAHVLKIDDDCFLDAGRFFPAQSWRKYLYYGRLLERAQGQTDRIWHQAKSTSLRGWMEIDKSPEPSRYCDGGSGYVLARQALEALALRAASDSGHRLIAASFMEDKLVGDLLAQAHIGPREEDHMVAVMRRSRPGATPVSVWANSFLPSRMSGVALAHLDRMESQAEAAALAKTARLWPPKIWPSYAEPKLLFNSNLLELLSPEDKLARLNAAPVAVVAVMRNEMFMLPHFLAHYRRMGVECFLVADNLSDDGTLDYLLQQPDVATFSVDSEYRVSHYGVAWQQALLSGLRVGRWSLVADADELLVLHGGATALPALLAGPEFATADAARVFMLDLYPGGALAEARFASGDPFAEAGFCDRQPFLANSVGRGPFGDQPTWTSALRHRLVPGSRPDLFVTQKLALLRYRPWMRLSAGLHYVAEARLAGRELLFAHFKYHAEFAAKVRAEVARRQHYNDAEEYRKYLALLQEGRAVIFDARVSVPWRECPEVGRLIA